MIGQTKRVIIDSKGMEPYGFFWANKWIMRRFELNELNWIFIKFLSDTIAFHSTLTSYPTIPDETAVAFNEVILNEAEG